ncbi:uncharacterized protein LOC126615904 [Malus sylvestris]|uniref:uncharacterized protein LOC126615904 n=1 Tax=Malus sylvestris TaxID=3752 RepID=UPI0021ABB3FB|nr:uncharacterized protein LOC126615904 [Malus sylvestris]
MLESSNCKLVVITFGTLVKGLCMKVAKLREGEEWSSGLAPSNRRGDLGGGDEVGLARRGWKRRREWGCTTTEVGGGESWSAMSGGVYGRKKIVVWLSGYRS